MVPTFEKYAIWPSVVPADAEVDMTITSTGRSFYFFDGDEYEVVVASEDIDNDYYHPARHQKIVNATAQGGVLSFRYAFPGEMEHTLILKKDGVAVWTGKIYSLAPDLFGLTPLKGDFHGHSYRSDGIHDAAWLAGVYREMGYDFLSLTDHNRFYPGGEIDEVYAGLHTGLCRVRGEELHFPGSPVHIVHVGGESSVAVKYLEDRSTAEAEAATELDAVPNDVPEEFRERYAKAKWVCDRIHEVGGLAIFVHPFWHPSGSYSNNVCTGNARILLKSGLFDAFELYSHCGFNAGINITNMFWHELREEGVDLPIVGSSDVHRVITSGTMFRRNYTICFAEKNEEGAILSSIKAKNNVAVHAVPKAEWGEYDYFCDGSYRLVAYAQFLLENYFPKRARLDQCVGVAMQRYAIGEATREFVTEAALCCEDYTDRFFGRKAPILPSAEMLAFEDKWREEQLRGPMTKGSAPFAEKITRQI